jgi:DNA-binding MarR family transcriptional regulator
MSNDFFSSNKSASQFTTYQVGALESASHRSLRQYKDKLLKPYGLTGMEWYVIGAVADSGDAGIRTTDLATLLGTTLGFLTKTLRLLEAKEIVFRKANADDARSSYLTLNGDYQKVVLEIEGMLRARLRESIYSLVSKEELETYIRVLEKFSTINP